MSSNSISAFSHDASSIFSSSSPNQNGGSAASIVHVTPVNLAPMSYELLESLPSWTETSQRLNDGTARDEIRHVNSVHGGYLLGGIERINLPHNFACFQGSDDAIHATVPWNLTHFLSAKQHNCIASVLGVPQNEWLAHEHYLLPNNIQQVTFHIHEQDNSGGFWEVTLNIRDGNPGRPQCVTACRIINDDRVEIACTQRPPLKLMSTAEFNGPGPCSPVAELGQFHLSASVESLQPVSKNHLKLSMETLLQHIVANIGGKEMPVVSNTARQQIMAAATGLLGQVQGTHPEDPEKLRALRAAMVQFLDEMLLPNLRTEGNAKRFTHDGVAWMGKVYFSQLFDTVTLDGARNRISRAGQLEPPKDLIGIAISRLTNMVCAIGTIVGGSKGTTNFAAAMFRIGEVEQGGNRVCALSDALIACSSVDEGFQKSTRNTLKHLKDGKFRMKGELAQKYADGVDALKSARLVPQNYRTENQAATPTFPLIKRVNSNNQNQRSTGAVDTEYRILAEILRQIEESGLDRSNIIGHVYLLTEFPVCGSCARAIVDFERQCPGLDVIVLQRTRHQTQDEPRPDGLKVFQGLGGIRYNFDDWIKTLDTDASSNPEAAVATAYDTESTNSEEPFFFQLPPQRPLVQPPPQQGGSSSHAGSNIRVDQIGGQNVTTIYGGGQMLFVADDLFALLSDAQIKNRNDFVRSLLPAILTDYVADVGSPSRTIIVNHDGVSYDVTYSVQGNQIMALMVDER